MTDQVLLSASERNIHECVQLAQEYGLGIELMAFAFPQLLDDDWQGAIDRYRPLLNSVPGKRSLHGPFMDMAPGSPDARINEVCIERYQHAIRIAAELDIHVVVFHANFIAAIHTMEYRRGWQQRNLKFWEPLADYAGQYDVTIAVENMWEFDPDIIGDVIRQIGHPNLRACLDIGHAYLFGEVPFSVWLDSLEDLVVHTHMNNHDGKLDLHRGLSQGVLEYSKILPQIRALPLQPSMTLEMDEVAAMRKSLRYLNPPRSTANIRDTGEFNNLVPT